MNDQHRRRVLDTDTDSLIQRGRQIVQHRIESFPPEQIAVTIITVEEQMRGWLADLHRAKEGTPRLLTAYQRFQQIIDYYANLPILPFDDAASEQLAELRKQKIRMGTQDLRIASIVLAIGGILVTCNIRDFSKISSLKIED